MPLEEVAQLQLDFELRAAVGTLDDSANRHDTEQHNAQLACQLHHTLLKKKEARKWCKL